MEPQGATNVRPKIGRINRMGVSMWKCQLLELKGADIIVNSFLRNCSL